jgi:hypothetical protein
LLLFLFAFRRWIIIIIIALILKNSSYSSSRPLARKIKLLLVGLIIKSSIHCAKNSCSNSKCKQPNNNLLKWCLMLLCVNHYLLLLWLLLSKFYFLLLNLLYMLRNRHRLLCKPLNLLQSMYILYSQTVVWNPIPLLIREWLASDII